MSNAAQSSGLCPVCGAYAREECRLLGIRENGRLDAYASKSGGKPRNRWSTRRKHQTQPCLGSSSGAERFGRGQTGGPFRPTGKHPSGRGAEAGSYAESLRGTGPLVRAGRKSHD
ncbi:hypothetical protein IF1G_03541 [Cordyceps javanica]|uniref:Uncharacterized protein n=1 Tax=Cordyceps javanica TaxID=43265 RepID=A0A545V7W8_9HYPO|nr:hypothetical protein IF1G_03541 [Cordyceps javanica]